MAQPQFKQDPYIKRDPDTKGSPASFADDALEDAGDLEFRDNDPRFKHVFLTRVPKYVWEQWENIGDDEEITLGTFRQSWSYGPDGSRKDTYSMLLDPQVPQHKSIPKEYKLDLTNQNVENTFFFTEADLPGFKTKSKRGFDEKTANLPARLMRSKDTKRADTPPYDPKKRFQPYYRRAIPKKTTLVGKCHAELNCVPVNNPETNRFLAHRTHMAMMPKKQAVRVDPKLMQGFIQPGTIMAQNSFGGFIKNTANEKKLKAQETKTARIPKNELMDLLFKCFREYKFWSMKALRAKLKQPEAYLRDILDEIADMPKSGRFAMKWTLKQHYQNINASAEENEAPDAGEEVDTDMADDDDDEDINFEDV